MDGFADAMKNRCIRNETVDDDLCLMRTRPNKRQLEPSTSIKRMTRADHVELMIWGQVISANNL